MEIGDIVDVNSIKELELGVYEDLDTGLIIAVKGDGAYRPTRDGLVLVDHGSLGNSFMRIK